MINSGINANMYNDSAINRDGGILEYCRLKDITIQAWSPFQYGMFEGVFLGNEKFPELNRVINELAEKYNVTDSAIALPGSYDTLPESRRLSAQLIRTGLLRSVRHPL